MLEINQDNTAEEVRDWIQDYLNMGYVLPIAEFLDKNLQRSYDGKLWDAVMQYEFKINYSNTFFFSKEIKGNTLLHLAVYVQVKKATMDCLLDIGMKHYAHLHANSSRHTPLKFADQLSQKFGGKYVQLSNHMGEWIAKYTGLATDEIVQDLFRNTDNPMINRRKGEDGEVEYVIVVDLLPFRGVEGYNLFNYSDVIYKEIQGFINTAINNHNRNLSNQKIQKDSIYFDTQGSRVDFISDNEKALRVLFGEEGGKHSTSHLD